MKIDLIVIGTSAGGINALQKLFSCLPVDFKTPMVIVLHRDKSTEFSFPVLFGEQYKGNLIEVSDKMVIEPNSIYFAPKNYHLLVESDFTLALSVEEKIHFSRPSIDLLFESAARSLKNRVCGLLLTGANDDGVEGLAFLQENGGMAVVQDLADAMHCMMPKSALDKIKPDFVGTLEEIANFLVEVTR